MKILKSALSRMKSPWTPLAIVLAFGIVAWSPSGGDPQIVLGTGGGNLNGFTGTANNHSIDVTKFKGFVGGFGNYVGSGFLGTNEGNSRWNLLVGHNNVGNSQSSVIAGNNNAYAKTGRNSDAAALQASGLFGTFNSISNSTGGLLVSGYGNSVSATMSTVAGANNTIEGVSSGTNCAYSAAIGLQNHVMATCGWAIGWANSVSGDQGVALGTGTIASNGASTALGRYNATMQSQDVLVIGNGSDYNNRATALRVTADGGVILGRAQGDIDMGIYGN